jgi:hypothetical protein
LCVAAGNEWLPNRRRRVERAGSDPASTLCFWVLACRPDFGERLVFSAGGDGGRKSPELQQQAIVEQSSRAVYS